MASLYAIHLQIRRSKYSFSFYLVNDIILITLWGIPVVHGEYFLFPMLLNPTINFINDIYGFYKWQITENKQNALVNKNKIR